MGPGLSSSAKRVQDFLSAGGFSLDVWELPGSTRTAQDATDSIGCTVSQIAKSPVFKLTPSDLEPLTNGRWIDLAKEEQGHPSMDCPCGPKEAVPRSLEFPSFRTSEERSEIQPRRWPAGLDFEVRSRTEHPHH